MEAAESGDTIFLKAGVYEQDEISLKDGVKLVGEGMDKVTLRCDIRRPRNVCVIVADRRHGLIKDLTVEHIGSTSAEARPVGIFLVDSSVEVVGCRIRKCVGWGMAIKNSPGVVRDCILEGNSFGGIDVMGKESFPTIEDCRIINNDNYGIYFRNEGSGLVQNNKIEENGTHGILIHGLAKTVQLKGNNIRANRGFGIYVWKGGNADVQDNICENNRKSGILVYKDDAKASLKSNKCVRNWESGIKFAKGTTGSAESNICEENGKDGIEVSGKARVTLSDNRCAENGENGIYFGRYSGGIAQANICEKNKSNGIFVSGWGAGPQLIKNQCTQNEENGILFDQDAQGTVAENVCSKNQLHGISIVDIQCMPIMNDNRCPDNGGKGISYADDDLGPVRELLQAEKFHELELIASRLRTEKLRSRGGNWKLAYFYDYLGKNWVGYGRPGKDWLLEVFDRWIKARPESITPYVAMARAYVTFAWDGRGISLASDVSAEGWKTYRGMLGKAKAVLEQAGKLEMDDPEVYHLLMQAEEGNSERAINRLFEQGIAVEQAYLPLYYIRAQYLMPRWGGSRGKLKAFVEEAVELTRESEGESLYARLISQLFGSYSFEEFKKLGFSYERMKQGYADLLERYPDTRYYLTSYCRVASLYGDKKTARELFDRIGDDRDSTAWWSESDFNKYKRWAYEIEQEKQASEAMFTVALGAIIGGTVVLMLIVLPIILIVRKKVAIKQR
jgi:parallel beta-helix repeat protein